MCTSSSLVTRGKMPPFNFSAAVLSSLFSIFGAPLGPLSLASCTPPSFFFGEGGGARWERVMALIVGYHITGEDMLYLCCGIWQITRLLFYLIIVCLEVRVYSEEF